MISFGIFIFSTSKPACVGAKGCEAGEASSSNEKCESEIVKQESVEKVVIEKPKVIVPPAEPTFQWRPVVHPIEPTFKAFVTNIGEDGSIQLHVNREGSY